MGIFKKKQQQNNTKLKQVVVNREPVATGDKEYGEAVNMFNLAEGQKAYAGYTLKIKTI